MDDDTKKAPGRDAIHDAKGQNVPWLALGVGMGVAIGAPAGHLAWGVGTGAAIGLALQQWFGRLAR